MAVALLLLAALLPHPRPIGVGPLYHPAPGARAVPGLACSTREQPRFGAHIELFARRLVVIVPAGIGVVPPRVRRGAYVLHGRCSYPLRTRGPTGVIELVRGSTLTLGDLFAVWGQPLSGSRLAGFSGTVSAFVGGRRWRGDPRAIPLTPHTQIVLETGGYVPPHPRYLFPKGL